MKLKDYIPYEITGPDEAVREKIQKNWDNVAKPIDGMGKFEAITAQIGAVLQDETVTLSKKAVIVMCADNGVVEEGISQSGCEVTKIVAEGMGRSESSVCRMALHAGIEVRPVDIGICTDEKIKGVQDCKIRRGTRNFAKEPAMTLQETVEAIKTGIALVGQCKKEGISLLGMGEMGIGNTTTSSAVVAALLKTEAKAVTGRGAGLDDAGLSKKCSVIDHALKNYQLYDKDALTVLATVGGLDIAGLAGVVLGGAIYHIPVVLDGLISMAAALAAVQLEPGVKAFLVPSHMGKEPAVRLLLEELGLEPVVHAQLALGEGTGAVMFMSMLDMALTVYQTMRTFDDAKIVPYERYGQEK